ncbi:MAG: hypothetical protein GY801_53410 [bacterium]|nr:hypothetical protein [bacterium]
MPFEGVQVQGKILPHGDQEHRRRLFVPHRLGELRDKRLEMFAVALVLKKLLKLIQDNHQRLAAEGRAEGEEILCLTSIIAIYILPSKCRV